MARGAQELYVGLPLSSILSVELHAELGRALRRRVGAGAPPDALAQALGIWTPCTRGTKAGIGRVPIAPIPDDERCDISRVRVPGYRLAWMMLLYLNFSGAGRANGRAKR
jgi:hypothetical protein